jgi:hypothetical protein
MNGRLFEAFPHPIDRKEDVVRKTSAWLLATALLAGLAGGCAQPTPEERVAEMRGRYTAELQNFVVREEPLPGAETMAEGMTEAGEEAAAGEDAGGEDGMEEMAAPVQTSIVLDVLIRNENQQNLPGLTLEVAQVAEGGPKGDEATWEQVVASPQTKATWRIYIDTATIGRGPGTSVTHKLQYVEGYEPGDGFVVTVRHPVPAGDRGEYREFAEAS